MQYAVPQFTDVEDKLIGPLTLKQFFIVLAVGGLLFLLWSILGSGILFFLVAIPIVAGGAFFTFKKYNGRPFYSYIMPLIGYMSSPKVMIFKREVEVVHFTTTKQAKKETPEESAAPISKQEGAQSRLKNLAYLLDQKNKEEKEIIDEVTTLTEMPKEIATLKTTPKVPKTNLIQKSVLSKLVIPTESPKPETKKFNPDDILKGL